MWKLTTEEGNIRTYTNSVTGSKCQQEKVYTDKEGNSWYQFTDLAQIPYTRSFAANKITSLYTLGLSKDDLTSIISKLKTILKSTDPDKYEKAYAVVLDFETKATNATDSIKQMSSLVCVYFTINNEPIDSFENSLQLKKMELLEADLDMHTFFLKRQTAAIENYTTSLNSLLQTVSRIPKDLLDHSNLKSNVQRTQKET